ncbi:MAG TPA: hypothetical protein VFP89_11440 [Propionibacteriaceae bacterium]|nr:hypothetical protein [Propionibacteriaceae bacterium]
MAYHVGAPISTAIQLDPSVTVEQITTALEGWLRKVHSVPLESAEHDDLLVEWRLAEEEHFTCHLVASDSDAHIRRTITVLRDHAGAVGVVEEAPLAAADAPHAIVDLSEPVHLLLMALAPLTLMVQGLRRGEVCDATTVTPEAILTSLRQPLAPGLVLAITGIDAPPSTPQAEMLEALLGLTVTGTVPAGAPLLRDLGVSAPPRPGSLISISRSATGLDAHMIGSTSLRAKPDSARRVVVRRQLAAPIPFDLERRRSAAMARLVATDNEIDLPSAMQLLEEESQRANDLGNRVKDLEVLLELAYEEQDAALSELDNAHSQVRYLQRAFQERGEVPIVEAEEDEDWHPDSCVDALVAARESLSYLIIGADEDQCAALDAQQKRGIWAKKIWSALRALNDYCRVKADGRFQGDIAMYRDDTPGSAVPMLAEYAPTESQSTTNNPALKALRSFPVPFQVEASGKVYMEQHVKIDKGGRSAPRIHIYDDSGGSTQRIYVGYVGPHLPTSSSF